MNGFNLDQSIVEFCLSHPNIYCHETGKIYSVNHGNFFQFDSIKQNYITQCQEENKTNGGPYSQKVHRQHGGRCPKQPDKRLDLFITGYFGKS